jgi:hypothetical protein
VIVSLKTVPILLLLGCAGADCGYPNVRRHFRFYSSFGTAAATQRRYQRTDVRNPGAAASVAEAELS